MTWEPPMQGTFFLELTAFSSSPGADRPLIQGATYSGLTGKWSIRNIAKHDYAENLL